MSGDHGREEYDEVNAMKNFAMDEDIASEDIFMDHARFSTYESMYRAKEVFFKLNTFGEEAFLEKLKEILR